jgi:membrane dipeptidase
MNRREFLACAALVGSDYRSWLEEARAIHRRIPVFLGYCNHSSEQFQASGGQDSDVEKFDAAGIRTFVTSIGAGVYFATGPRQYELAGSDEWVLRKYLENVDRALKLIRQCSRMRLVTRASQLKTHPKDNSIGVIVHISGNNHTLNLGVVDKFFECGVRAWHPAMQYHNRWCAGKGGMPAPTLSDFGRQVIARMNEVGIVLDTAHASDETAQAFVKVSKKPVIDSHTTSSTVAPQSRGLSDQTLKMIAGSRGVIGVHFATGFLVAAPKRRRVADAGYEPRLFKYNRWVLESTKDPEERMRLRKNAEAQEKFYRQHNLPPEPGSQQQQREPRGTVSHLADLVEYLVRLVGMEHVGIGGDVNGIDRDWPTGMQHTGELPHLTAELLRRGYKEDRLRKLLSDNWRRVYSQVLPA